MMGGERDPSSCCGCGAVVVGNDDSGSYGPSKISLVGWLGGRWSVIAAD